MDYFRRCHTYAEVLLLLHQSYGEGGTQDAEGITLSVENLSYAWISARKSAYELVMY